MSTPSKLVSEWISKADDDLEYAKVGFEETDLYANVCFSCQQAFEKYLKAYILYHKYDFPKTHDLSQLLSSCIKIDTEFKEFQEAADTLSPYGTTTRYPDFGDIQFTKKQAEEAIGFVKRLQGFIRGKLN